ncbi:MAG: hypothetical protein H5U08_10795 [Thermogutta sp.]|uniref:hypothetical protein n=1 Tax=Thermogutta sp. TaxID=1962930 RepID=UPI0019A57D7F|nr:hypothetical protein [Thermogutta sp.]MBC7352835.1 hypothetical protein [Thermogutta sp.]
MFRRFSLTWYLRGVASLAPILVYLPLFCVLVLSFAHGFWDPTLFSVTFVTGIVVSLAILCVAAYYVYRVYNDSHLTPDQKIMWALLLLGFAPIGCPLFWWTMDKPRANDFTDGLRTSVAVKSQPCHDIDDQRGQKPTHGHTATLMLGAASLGWLLFAGAFVLVMFSILIEWKPPPAIGFGVIFVAAIGAFATMTVVGYFLYHVSRNDSLRPDQRKFWALVLVLLWPLAAPAYWYCHIYKATCDNRKCAQSTNIARS